jgi:PAS domain S-box-containing protein
LSTIGILISDLSEKVRAKQLEESEERFRTLAETLPSLVWMTDKNGKQLYASERWEQYAGIRPHSETTWMQIIHPDDLKNINREWTRSFKTGKGYHIDVRLKNKDNEYRWHNGISEPLHDGNNEIIRWIGSFTDIHEQKVFAEKLEKEVENRTNELLKFNQELESFNYVASHDLQEPLRKIQTFINLLLKSRDDKDLLEKYSGKIRVAGERMSNLIQSLLEYSRISQSPGSWKQTDLNDVLENVKSDYELLIAERNVTIISQSLPTINAIPLQMQQVFGNLISNSIKFSTGRPLINISSAIVSKNDILLANVYATESLEKFGPGQKFAEIKFADNGIGFEPQFSEKIFQLFQRLHGKAEYAGTGIGLSIVKKIIEQHNGIITARAEDGMGATFAILLPVL